MLTLRTNWAFSDGSTTDSQKQEGFLKSVWHKFTDPAHKDGGSDTPEGSSSQDAPKEEKKGGDKKTDG
jgi:hypothetical protein